LSQHSADARQSADGRHRAAAPRHHHVLRTFGYCLLTLTVGMMLFVSYTVRTLTANVDVIGTSFLPDRPVKEKVEGPREPLNVLVMGSDSRDGQGNNIDGLTGDGERSDTTILLHLSADRQHAYGVSLPRDAMVQRPDCKKPDGKTIPGGFAMWNAAFAYGGPTCTLQQVEALTGIRIDHFVVVDFGGFRGMVNAVDGVKICVPEEVNDTTGHIHLDAGTRVVRGKEALDYVRVRHGISANGDIGRMKRQQVFIASMIDRVMSAGVLARPDRLIGFLKAATKSLTVDDGLKDIRKMASLGMEFKDIDMANIKFITVPFQSYEPDPNRLEWKTDEANVLWRKIRKDLPLTRKLSSEAVTAGESDNSKPSPSGSPSASASSSPSTGPSEEEKTREEIAHENGLCA
jgi:LCP family protein required for cell wall assembly